LAFDDIAAAADSLTAFPRFPLPVVLVEKRRRLTSMSIGSSPAVVVTVEETDIMLSNASQPSKAILRSWALESEDRVIVEAMGRYWAAWSAGIITDLQAGASNVQEVRVSGVLSYPEVVQRFSDEVKVAGTRAASVSGL
jgi:hypothetical protein